MSPMIGQIIAIAAVLCLAFICGRSTLRAIRAELRGEGTCAGCKGCGKSGADCCACMQQMEELKQLKEKKRCSECLQEK